MLTKNTPLITLVSVVLAATIYSGYDWQTRSNGACKIKSAPKKTCCKIKNKTACEKEMIAQAVAVLSPSKGQRTTGVFRWQQLPDGKVKVSGWMKGLKPNAKHGMHIHEYGDTRAEDAKSAGGHYNPNGHAHGLRRDKERHAGAYGNLESNANGEAMFTFIDDSISVAGKKNPILGRSLVVHANEDTGAQPAGNAGPRIAVGVIGIANVDFDQ